MKATIYKTGKALGKNLENIGEFEMEYRDVDVCERQDKQGDIEWGLINIYPQVTYHTFHGFGGAFTEAAAVAMGGLSADKQEALLRAYFDPDNGIGYTIGRISINSCDFSVDDYMYIEDGDESLESFDITHDTKEIMPMIKRAADIAGGLWLFASPWTPPTFMKTVDCFHGGHLDKKYYALWAKYIRRFVEEYAKHGIKISGVTMQNEPRHHQIWESCLYTREEESEFVGYLYEELKGLDVKIICYDHCRERITDRAETVFGGKNGDKCDGIANHIYSGDHFGEVRMVRERWPEKIQIASEGCFAHTDEGIETEWDWYHAEQYAHDISGMIDAGTHYYCDWNLTLDEHNGPFHHREGRNRVAEAPVYAHNAKNELVFMPAYYYIGHYSKFIRPGAVCIGHSSYTNLLDVCTFKNPDGSIVCVVLNTTAHDRPFTINLQHNILKLNAESHTVQTVVITE